MTLQISTRTRERLTGHQLDVLRLYAQLGTYAAVADFRGTTDQAAANTLKIVREKLGVATTAEAVALLRELSDG